MVVNGYISQASLGDIRRRMDILQSDFHELVDRDSKLDKDDLLSVTLVAAVRPWAFSVFDQFARNP